MMAENKSQSSLEISVTDPQTVAEGRQKHTHYLVESKTLESRQSSADPTSVRRRYSDFQWLYQRLLEEVPGAFIPLIPHKQAVRDAVRFSEDFVQERLMNLHRFMRRVGSHPELQDSPSLKVFLTAFSDEWEKARTTRDAMATAALAEGGGSEDDLAKGGVGIDGDDKEGATSPAAVAAAAAATGGSGGSKIGTFFQKARAKVMIAAGTEMEKTPDDTIFAGLDEYINNMDVQLRSMAKDAIGIHKATKERAQMLDSMSKSYKELAEKRYPGAYNDDLSYLFTEVGDEVTAIANLELRFEKKEETQFTDPMQDLAREVQSAKVALQRRKEILFDYTRKVAMAKQAKAKFEKAKATAADVDNAKRDAFVVWKLVEDVSKRIQREMESFRVMFEDKLRTLMTNYSQTQAAHCGQLEKNWLTLIPIVTPPDSKASSATGGMPPMQAFGASATPPSDPPPPEPEGDGDGASAPETKLV